jgi:7-carboxy-7-deazaguanine synthase
MSKHPEISEKLDKFPIFQGEGTFTGEPCTFLRTAFCSLNCVFCDIPQSWAFDRYSIEEEAHPMTLDEVFRAITATSKRVNHLVISGGEPMLQQGALAHLTDRLHKQNLQ